MIGQVIELLSGWQTGDTRVVIAGALAAMACALPGNFLLVRRQSMMGDAISHTVLPGIVLAFLGAHAMRQAGWIPAGAFDGVLHFALIGGAVLLGILCAVTTQWVQRIGKVESSAALGVVFTSLFAFGLLLLRMKANDVHLDPDCVLFGSLEALFLNTESIPRAYWINGAALVANLALVILLFKELRFSSFDPFMATTMGFNASFLHYGLMAVTAATLVAAFETVGSILVIAMLITPSATAYLLTDRLKTMIILSLVIAALTAVLGRAAAIVAPTVVLHSVSAIIPEEITVRLGLARIDTASTSGMMAVCGAGMLCVAVLLGPRYGLLSKAFGRFRLAIEITGQDIMGRLYREEERNSGRASINEAQLRSTLEHRRGRLWLALKLLLRRGKLMLSETGYALTDSGREEAKQLVRSHRLFESYMAMHFELPHDHLHQSAELVEHFLDSQMQQQIENELDAPDLDPHGRAIPPAASTVHQSNPPSDSPSDFSQAEYPD